MSETTCLKKYFKAKGERGERECTQRNEEQKTIERVLEVGHMEATKALVFIQMHRGLIGEPYLQLAHTEN